MTWQFDRCGGHLAIDFANTVSERPSGAPIERLPGYADLVEFARQAELIDRRQATALLDRAAAEPEQAARVHREALVLREALYHAFTAAVRGEPPAAGDLAALNRWAARLRITPERGWRLDVDPEGLDRILDPIVRAAVALYTGADVGRVAICAEDSCQWLFYDASRNHSRRWCDMQQCGNRDKARRHYQRQKRSARRSRAGSA